MSLTPAVLDALLAAGATADMIVAAVKADMAESEARKDKKREGNAERQRRFKARRRVTPDNTDNALPDVTPPNDIYSNPPVNFPKPAKAGFAPKPKRGLALPDDWQPVLTPASQRLVDGWPPGRLESELAKFRDYAADKGRTSKDWQAAFRTWLTNSEKWNPSSGRTGQQSNQRGGSNRNAAHLALAKLGHG